MVVRSRERLPSERLVVAYRSMLGWTMGVRLLSIGEGDARTACLAAWFRYEGRSGANAASQAAGTTSGAAAAALLGGLVMKHPDNDGKP